MLVKGIVIEVLSDNKLSVRLPVFETAGATNNQIVSAIVSYTPGNIQNYRVNDVVIVGFENDQLTQPIVIGKLYTGKESIATNYAFCDSLEVITNAKLPVNTMIGDMNFSNVLNNLNIIKSLQDEVAQLESRINELENR